MPTATDRQVQNYVDQRVRPHAELLRSLVAAFSDDKIAIDDVYAALTQGSPTWRDTRQDGPPHLVLGSDVLAYNGFITDILTVIQNHGSYHLILTACVQAPRG